MGHEVRTVHESCPLFEDNWACQLVLIQEMSEIIPPYASEAFACFQASSGDDELLIRENQNQAIECAPGTDHGCRRSRFSASLI